MARPTVTQPPSRDLQNRQREWAEDDRETEAASLMGAASETTESIAPQTFLMIREGERASFLELCDPGEWIIGRSPDAHVVVDHRQVSRHHARLTLAQGVLAIEDLGSRNGTVVNGGVLHRRAVRIGTGDVVEVGRCQLVVATRTGRVAAPRSPSGEDFDEIDVVLGDPEMARLYASVRKVARMPTTVLILGETGSGKDVLAQRLHAHSPRASKPFVRINCAGIPESLLESELFGYERGAFTGADRRKAGYFEAANGGTIFLDEIGELSEGAQVRLLHVLENRTVTRLGGTAPMTIDVRVVCATHRDLQALVAAERFRADLFYRISPFMVRIPPLRKRPAEIPLLADVFLRQLASQVGTPPPTIAPDAIAMLTGYAWPGNIRELRNAVEHAFVMAEGATLRREHFAPEIRGLTARARAAIPPAPKRMRERLVDEERKTIEEALAAEGGNQTRAAARLGMPRRTLVHKLTQYRRQLEEQERNDGHGDEG
jgi:transcriptional regulator with PAS, ATPase and Fis domain